MADEKGDKKDTKDDAAAREERMQRLHQLLHDRGEDAAKMVKTWLSQAQEKGK
jgi:flagellar biosynthesis/type III secretory pathway M-ring protein FliF/YscJ